MTINKIIIIITFLIKFCLFAQEKISHFPTDDQNSYYTVQVKSFPVSEIENARTLYNSLKEKGYLVYFKYKRIDQRNTFIRVRIEVFKNISDAKLFAERIKETEGFDYFIDRSEIFIDNYHDQFLIITTPQSIYYKDTEKTIEINHNGSNDQARISPDGKDIVFYQADKIIKQNIESKKITILKQQSASEDELESPMPRWSPDGKYIAYLRYNVWEMPTELWIITPNGDENKCIINCGKEKKRSVKYFLWHPTENKIFYVFGTIHGTVSVGGNICVTDLDGNNIEIIKEDWDKRQEPYREFRIVDNILYYKMAHFDEQFLTREYKLNIIDINKINF